MRGPPCDALTRRDGRWAIDAGSAGLTADNVVIATNAYTGDLWPGLRESIIPMRGHGFVTEPLSDNVRHTILPERQSLTDTRLLYSGVRMLPDGRLHGSAHGPSFGAEPRADWRRVDARIRRLFPQLGAVKWQQAWTGWVAMTTDHFPRLHELAPGLYAGLGYNGRGIAAATMMGRDLATLVRGARDDATVFPLTPLRPLGWHRVAPTLVPALCRSIACATWSTSIVSLAPRDPFTTRSAAGEGARSIATPSPGAARRLSHFVARDFCGRTTDERCRQGRSDHRRRTRPRASNMPASSARPARASSPATSSTAPTAARRPAHGAVGVTLDVTDIASADSMVELAMERFGRVDALINNAALYGSLRGGRFNQIAEADWDATMAVNVKGIWNCCKAVVPAMRQSGGGSIINIASLAATYGMPFALHYTTSKAAVIGLTRGLARELGRDNIRVNALAPSAVMTEGTAEFFGERLDRGLEVIRAGQSIQRTLEPADLTGTVAWLISDGSRFVTGQTIAVDGGTVML